MMLRTLSGIVLGFALGIAGCNKAEPEDIKRMDERNADYLEEKMRRIAVYQRFNDGRYGVSYQTFTDVPGINRELPQQTNNWGVWIEVISKSKPDAHIEQGIIREGAEDAGRVRVDLPYSKALEIKHLLTEYKNRELGIKSLEPNFWEGTSSGGY